MQPAIERKFLVVELPDLCDIQAISYEKRFISITASTEIRIQRKGLIYQLQRKVIVASGDHTKQKRQITEEEFQQLKQSAIHTHPILRDTHKLSSSLQICIYHGEHTGLIRAEVEFQTVEEAETYIPEDWMGREITNEKEGRDRNLVN